MAMIVGSSAANTGMAGAIYTDLVSTGFVRAGTASQAFCDQLANAIVNYIQANAVVPALGLVAPGGGGPVTGQAAVT